MTEADDLWDGIPTWSRPWLARCLALLALVLLLIAPARAARFQRFTIENGLSQNSVFALVQDNHGFLWIGTLEGLNRFDGYQFKQYKHQPLEDSSLSDNFVQTLVKDSQGRIWVGTAAGLNLYDEASDSFLHYELGTPDSKRWEIHSSFIDHRGQLWLGTQMGLVRYLPGEDRFILVKLDRLESSIHAINQDGQNNLWLGTREGLVRYNSETGRAARYQAADYMGLPSDEVRSLLPDGTGGLWVATKLGLTRFFPDRGSFQPYLPHKDRPQGPAGLDVNVLYRDHHDNLWVGYRSEGLDRLDQNTGAFIHYRSDPTDRDSLSHNGVIQLLADQSGVLWVGTDVGLNKYDPASDDFGLARRLTTDPLCPGCDDVRALCVDNQNEVWLGTYGQGLTHKQSGTAAYRHYRHDPQRADSLSGNIVWMVQCDSHDQLWVGTDTGLSRYLPERDAFRNYPSRGEREGGIANPTTYTFLEDPQGRRWFGTAGGLSLYRPQSDDFATFLHDPEKSSSLSSDKVWCLAAGLDGHLWVGTGGGGLNDFDPESDRSIRYGYNPEPGQGLPNGQIYCLLPGRGNEALWIGSHAGLARLDYGPTEHFKVWTEADGLPSSTICALQWDNHGQLWISTKRGLACLQPETGAVKVYHRDDGLQNEEFNENASFRGAAGLLYFGGVEGYNAFYGERITADTVPPKLVLTELFLFNHPVRPSNAKDRGLLPVPIANMRELRLSHRESMITLEMAALHLAHPDQNVYEYMLEGLDTDWLRTTAAKRYATYTALAPGRYTFKAKAANRDGRWGDQTALVIVIEPPPWLTIWAKLLYGVLACGLLAAAFLFSRRKLQRERELAQQMRRLAEQDQALADSERRTVARLREIDRLKDEFLANTSHELRTPLNGIIGLAETLSTSPIIRDPEVATHVELIIASGKRLASLVNDILDFSKLKSASLVLDRKPVNAHVLVQAVVAANRATAERKHIVLENMVPQDLPLIFADVSRLRQIFQNLVGNALKFTHSGSVRIDAYLETDSVHFTVSDTGIGIPPEKLERIFESFEQADGSSERQFGGCGLGLSITRLLVGLHGGEIAISSAPERGTRIAFDIQVARESELRLMEQCGFHDALEGIDHPPQRTATLTEQELLEQANDLAQAHLLLVDDEPVNRRILISMLLAENFRITEAEDGPTALQLLERSGPFDLVLLDLMMPRMTGYEACKRIRELHPAHELPVLILTAKDQPEDLVRGFENGANDYLIKPINKVELLARVRMHLSLLNSNRLLEDQVRDRTRELREKNEALVRTHQQMVVQEKMVSLGVLTAGISHEINNPTNFVYAGVQNLRADLDKFSTFLLDITENEDPEIMADIQKKFGALNQHIGIILEGAGRIRSIVRDLHTFSHSGEAEVKEVDLAENLASTLNLVQAQYHERVRFVTDLEPGLRTACTPAELNQVFLNLIVNACQSIETRLAKADQTEFGTLWVRAWREQELAYVEFEDEGTGIAKPYKNRIFEPFFTTKPVGQGTGLGLSIAYGIVEQHGGRIEVFDRNGPGAKLRVQLPLRLTV